MTQKNFNWGLLGPGLIAQQFAEDLKVVEGASLYAVASNSLERAGAFGQKYGSEKIYDSYEALVNDPNVDAVYIATPHNFHLKNTLLCLNAGKPVLCEKPLTVNAGETRILIDAASKNKVFLLEAVWTRYLPIFSEIRKWLDDGAIGDITLLSSTFGFSLPMGKEQRWLNPQLAGGTLLDMGVYPVSTSQWVMGQMPASFSARAVLAETGVDILTSVLLKYPNGVISQFNTNFVSDNVNDMYIYGSKGYIRIYANYWGSSKATLSVAGQDLTVSRPLRASGFEYEIEETMRCVRAGLLQSPGMPHAQTLANMELLDAIRAEIGVRYPFEE